MLIMFDILALSSKLSGYRMVHDLYHTNLISQQILHYYSCYVVSAFLLLFQFPGWIGLMILVFNFSGFCPADAIVFNDCF